MTEQLLDLRCRRPTVDMLRTYDKLVEAHFAEFKARTSDTPEACEHLKTASQLSIHCINTDLTIAMELTSLQDRQPCHEKLGQARLECRENPEKRLKIVEADTTAGERLELHLALQDLYAFEISLYRSDTDVQLANSERSVYHLAKAIAHSVPSSS